MMFYYWVQAQIIFWTWERGNMDDTKWLLSNVCQVQSSLKIQYTTFVLNKTSRERWQEICIVRRIMSCLPISLSLHLSSLSVDYNYITSISYTL